MNILLENFPDPTSDAFTPGQIVSGTVRFRAEGQETYAVLGYQVRVLVKKALAEKVLLLHSEKLAMNITLRAGEEKVYKVSFTVPESPAYQGVLFSLQPQVRAYAFTARKGSSALLRRHADNYATYSSFNYQPVATRPLFTGVTKMESTYDKTGWLTGLKLFSISTLFLFALHTLAGVFGMLFTVFFGFRYLVSSEKATQIVPPGLEVINQGANHFTVKLGGYFPNKLVSRLKVHYYLRESLFMNAEPAGTDIKATEPAQLLPLSEQNTYLIEHQYLPFPGKVSSKSFRLEWIYVVEATLKAGEKLKWEGTLVTS